MRFPDAVMLNRSPSLSSFSARGESTIYAPQPNRPHADDTAIRLDYNLRTHGDEQVYKTTANYAAGGPSFQAYRDDEAKPYAQLDMPKLTANPFTVRTLENPFVEYSDVRTNSGDYRHQL